MNIGRWIAVCSLIGGASVLLADELWQGVIAALMIEWALLIIIDHYHPKKG
jgi:hypothetical protein